MNSPANLQKSIQNLLNSLVAEGKERGAQVAVYHDGKLIVDAWAGVADVRTGAPVDAETLFPVFSTTKGLEATVIHILAERGQIEYDKPIAHYWPEFAANGKEAITVRHALAHTSGIPYMPVGIGHKELCDWDTMCRLVAQLKPAWPAGQKSFYHPVTFGWILGEVARRVDGRAFQPFVDEEIAGPLGINTMFAGIPAELEPRVAFLEEHYPPTTPPETPQAPPNPAEQGVPAFMNPLGDWMNRSDARRACIPASNGIMNARAIARHYAALLPGGVDGVELLPPSRMKLATELQIPGEGFVEGTTPRKGLGYGLGDGGSATGFGHGGYGGSSGYGNPLYRLAVGVTRNRFSYDDLAGLVTKEIREALGIS
jgi:CubicO group peptidase (beta-lactamase class C family)